MEEKLNLAYSKLDELLEVHKDYPMTTNSHFINHSRTPRQDSSKKNLESMLRGRLQSGQDVSVDEITQMMSTITTKADLDMDMVAAEEAFDNMNAYYEVWKEIFHRQCSNSCCTSTNYPRSSKDFLSYRGVLDGYRGYKSHCRRDRRENHGKRFNPAQIGNLGKGRSYLQAVCKAPPAR
jgi:hypothetical protein